MPDPVSVSAWLIRTRVHNDRHRGLIRNDDQFGVGTVIQFVFEIIRRERFRDGLLRLGLSHGADAQAFAFSLCPNSQGICLTFGLNPGDFGITLRNDYLKFLLLLLLFLCLFVLDVW